MKEYKNKIIITASISIVMIILMIIMSIIRKNANTDESSKLNDLKTFFTIKELINNETMSESYMYCSYLPEEIYYKDFDLLTIYFVKGAFIGKNETTDYVDNTNYMIKIKGADYEISNLSYVTNIKEYADKYNEENMSINADNILPSVNYEEKAILSYYISLFENLYDVNPDKAYNYLSDNMKDTYTLDSFKNENILLQLNTNIQSYVKKQKGKNVIYTINTNGKTITIVENSLLDFTIEF